MRGRVAGGGGGEWAGGRGGGAGGVLVGEELRRGGGGEGGGRGGPEAPPIHWERLDGSEGDYSDAASRLRRKARFHGGQSDHGRRGAGTVDHGIQRFAQASLHRRWQAAQLRERVCKRRGYSLFGERKYSYQGWRYHQHCALDCWRKPPGLL